MKLFMIGDTVKATLVQSGAVFATVTAAFFDGSETLVNCGPMTSSGNGHYYRYMTLPSSPGYYAVEMRAVNSDSFPVVRRSVIQAQKMEVD